MKKARILGVTFTKTLNFSSQIFETKNSVESRLNLLRAIGGRPYGGQRKCLLNLFRSIAESKIFFAINTVGRKGANSLKSLMPCYNAGIRIASGAMRSSPILSMNAESGTLPWKFQLTQRLTTNTVRLLEKPHGIETSAAERSFDAFQALTGQTLPKIARTEYVGIRPWNLKNPNIDWAIKNQFKVGDSNLRAIQLFKHHLNEKYAGFLEIYTDGSVANGKVGFGIVGGPKQLHYQLAKECTIFSAEAMAILHALKNIASKSRYTSVIFSDSASVLAAVESGKSSHPWIQCIEREVIKLKCVLCWIPGHVGIEGNTKADKLAEMGRNGPMIETDTPGQDIVTWVRNEVRTKWEQAWDNNRQLFLRRIKNNTRPWNDRNSPLERRALTRLRIGHTVMTHAEFFTKGITTCSTCNEPLTVSHIIGECRQYETERRSSGIGYNAEAALDPANEENLIKFLKSANLLCKI